MEMIQVAKPYFVKEDIDFIMKHTREVLESGMLMQGEWVGQFEEAFAEYCGTRYARAVNAGTSALIAALDYLGCEGREVLVPTNTFLASANAVIFAGATPVFCDIVPATLLIDYDEIVARTNENTAGLILVHQAGLIPPDLQRIREYCRDKGLFLLEDSAHAAGSSSAEGRAGSLGDAAAFSMLATKIITSGGEGGMVTTNSEELAHRVVSLRFHGEDSKRGIQDRVGYSWRMTEIQAIAGLTQVRRLDEIIAKRMDVAARYDAGFAGLGKVNVLPLPEGVKNAYYKYPLILADGLKRPEVKERLEKEFGVKSGTSYWPPCHLQPAYRDRYGYKEGDYPRAEAALNQTIALPMHCHLTDDEVGRVIEAVSTIVG
ncbi:MAG: DegT/DnrJ/EryC1/StrS family aminotransferase [bacterium]